MYETHEDEGDTHNRPDALASPNHGGAQVGLSGRIPPKKKGKHSHRLH